ncbi:PEP-CTERM sorting domain-containing protein [Haloferula sp. BvORR071]|uniref:PEP-CTERM sorting domain-containing protein n=1 Tax=Haloferula sp. BvORR071 TaxID=1396141 RepID=UPI002240F466|nr:PEP-CTERM sorting domain-containing protein [Haloferula sp. BvORR071]
MKFTSLLLLSCACALPASAVNLMLDFGNPATNSVVADPYLTLSPAHSVGAIPGTQTSWNTITTSSDRTDLIYANGNSASTLTLDLGQESTGGNGTIDFGTGIGNLTLAGTGGGASGQQSLLGTGSIYGTNTSSTAATRDGFFGSGAATTTGAAIGMRLDGLAAGDYVAYVMARNTNTSTASYPMNIYSSVAGTSTSFAFSSLAAAVQANPGYTTAAYAGQFTSFVLGDNYQKINFTIAEGQSFFLAVDGGNDAIDRRGFLNMVQVVSVPEPSSLLLGALGLLCLRRRR